MPYPAAIVTDAGLSSISSTLLTMLACALSGCERQFDAADWT